jgi:formamidase
MSISPRDLQASILLLALVCSCTASDALAASFEVKAFNTVTLERTGQRCADDPLCFNRLHPAIPMSVRAKPGDHIVFETRDAADSDFDLQTQFPRDLRLLDRNRVHPLTGPVHIEGARRGDVLAITILDIAPVEYGWTAILPSGLLADRFPGPPRIVNWKLDRLFATSDQIPGVRIPNSSFPGIVTVLPGPEEVVRWRDREAKLRSFGGVVLPPESTSAVPASVCGPQGNHKDECLRTIPPREHGGNLDVKQIRIGATLLLPCYVDGCGLAIGDVHYAQGDGEVSGTAIEMAATITVRTEIRPGRASVVKVPHFEGGAGIFDPRPSAFYATTGFPLKKAGEVPPFLKYLESPRAAELENLSQDLTLAARNALIEMIDYLVREHALTPDQAYVIASVAVDLRIGQMVDSPNFGVSAVVPLDIFTPAGRR